MTRIIVAFIVVSFSISSCLTSSSRIIEEIHCLDEPSPYESVRYKKYIKESYPFMDSSVFEKNLVIFDKFYYNSGDDDSRMYILDIESGDLLKVLNGGYLKVIKKSLLKPSNRGMFNEALSKLEHINLRAASSGLDGSYDNFRIIKNGVGISNITTEDYDNDEAFNSTCLSIDQKKALVYIYKVVFGAKYRRYKMY